MTAPRMKWWLAFLALVLAVPLSAQIQPSATPSATVSSATGDAAELKVATARALELERRNAILEAKEELNGSAYSRLEILIGVFGVLMTALVIYFSFKAEGAARTVAQKETGEELARTRSGFEVVLDQERKRVSELEAKLADATGVVENMKTMLAGMEDKQAVIDAAAVEAQEAADKVQEIVVSLQQRSASGDRPELSETERRILDAASEATKDTAQNQWTVEQFRSAITKARFADNDQLRAIELARDMAKLHGGDDDAYAFAMNNLGNAELEQKHYTEALEAYEAVLERLATSRSATPNKDSDWALHHAGICLGDLGRAIEAEVKLRSALESSITLEGAEAPGTLVTRHELTRSILEQGRAQEAEDEFRALLTVRAKVNGAESSEALATRHELTRSILQQGRAQEAEDEFRSLLLLCEKVDGFEASDTLATRHELARSILQQGRAEEAIDHFQAILPLCEKVDGSDALGTHITRYWFALALVENGNLASAKAILDVVPDPPNQEGWMPRHHACCAYVRGKLADAQGDTAGGTSHLAHARAIFAQHFSENYHDRRVLEDYIEKRGGL